MLLLLLPRFNCTQIAAYHFEGGSDVTAEDPRLQRLHVAPHIRLRVQQVTIRCQFVQRLESKIIIVYIIHW